MNSPQHLLLVIALTFGVLGRTLLAAELPRTSDYDYDPPAPGSYTLPVVKSAADGDVLDSKGRPLRLRNLTRGRVTVLSFIYTRCAAAKACPYATGVLMQLHRLSSEDPALAKGMRLVSMSFDPAVDTPEHMAAYAMLADGRSPASEWSFLTTRSQEELQPILEAYGQALTGRRTRSTQPGRSITPCAFSWSTKAETSAISIVRIRWIRGWYWRMCGRSLWREKEDRRKLKGRRTSTLKRAVPARVWV